MSKITIPPAALEAGKQELYPHLLTENDDMAREIARAAFVAMVESWEGKLTMPYSGPPQTVWEPYLILPITENPDDNA